jgi:hypothetical protein
MLYKERQRAVERSVQNDWCRHQQDAHGPICRVQQDICTLFDSRAALARPPTAHGRQIGPEFLFCMSIRTTVSCCGPLCRPASHLNCCCDGVDRNPPRVCAAGLADPAGPTLSRPQALVCDAELRCGGAARLRAAPHAPGRAVCAAGVCGRPLRDCGARALRPRLLPTQGKLMPLILHPYIYWHAEWGIWILFGDHTYRA